MLTHQLAQLEQEEEKCLVNFNFNGSVSTI